ncbi:hypothetical protein [Marinobacter sp. CP1]|uniref:hypothetical protein n=1 Tax=Marinobacter TaxID=2742 RepID=UPI00114070D4|nr:hypothetical protein [Marinobacter sp. CP1]
MDHGHAVGEVNDGYLDFLGRGDIGVRLANDVRWLFGLVHTLPSVLAGLFQIKERNARPFNRQRREVCFVPEGQKEPIIVPREMRISLSNKDFDAATEYGLPSFIHLLLLFLLVPAWLLFSFWIIPPSTNWIMSTGISFLLKPFENTINKRLDSTLEDGCSEFNRVDGQVRIALCRGRFFEAPFAEFDAYVERVVQHGGIFYRLMLVHRYTQKTFNKTGFSTIESEKSEVLALWDMLQRYMDVTQPLPDTPRLEPFRHLDPVTAEHDRKTGRNPRYWRDLDLESWKDGEGWTEVHQRQSRFPWGSRTCKLTPQLGKISMEEYRKLRPPGAWPI